MTRSELEQFALEKLGVSAAGGPYPADDREVMTRKYVWLHAQLIDQSLATWAYTEEIPEELREPMIAMLAYAAAAEFGVNGEDYTRLRSEGSLGEDRPSLAEKLLRANQAAPFIYQPVAVEFF